MVHLANAVGRYLLTVAILILLVQSVLILLQRKMVVPNILQSMYVPNTLHYP